MSPVTATTRCMCISSASCWALVTQLWENGVLTPTASLQMNEMQMQLPPPPCHLLPSYSVMPISTPPFFQVRSVPCWVPLPLGRGDLQSWLTLLSCCRWRWKLRSPLDPYSQGGCGYRGAEHQLVPPHTSSLSHCCQMTEEVHFPAGPHWQYPGRGIKGWVGWRIPPCLAPMNPASGRQVRFFHWYLSGVGQVLQKCLLFC